MDNWQAFVWCTGLPGVGAQTAVWWTDGCMTPTWANRRVSHNLWSIKKFGISKGRKMKMKSFLFLCVFSFPTIPMAFPVCADEN